MAKSPAHTTVLQADQPQGKLKWVPTRKVAVPLAAAGALWPGGGIGQTGRAPLCLWVARGAAGAPSSRPNSGDSFGANSGRRHYKQADSFATLF